MTKLSSRLWQSLRFRWAWAKLGIWFVRSSAFRLEKVRVHGKTIPLNFPEKERSILEHELGLIYYHDCYRLKQVSRPGSIVDIGANVGLFSLVARHHFSQASLHVYEPNPSLQPSLHQHLDVLNTDIFPVAVGCQAGKVNLNLSQNSLHSTVSNDSSGEIEQVAFAEVVKRAGGHIDLLKLDAEGAEWNILTDTQSLQQVTTLRMEYHLWAKEGATVEDLEKLLTDAGFSIDFIDNEPGKAWGLMGASRPA